MNQSDYKVSYRYTGGKLRHIMADRETNYYMTGLYPMKNEQIITFEPLNISKLS